MMMDFLELSHHQIRHIRSLKDKRFRARYQQTLIEGEKLVKEAMSGYTTHLDYLVVREDKSGQSWISQWPAPVYTVPYHLFDTLSLDPTPCGILAVISIPPSAPIPPGSNLLILNAISNPGNLGTLIRSAEAFGLSSIITDSGCVEMSNPKVIKASMGSSFRVAVYEHRTTEEIVDFIRQYQYQTLALDSRNGVSIWEFRPQNPWAILVGNESHGLSPDYYPHVTPLHIPMSGRAESLNASISGAIALAALTRS